ncbi:MAG: hypothetical protein AABY22_00380 [Nanoarchaeota archaeon]
MIICRFLGHKFYRAERDFKFRDIQHYHFFFKCERCNFIPNTFTNTLLSESTAFSNYLEM